MVHRRPGGALFVRAAAKVVRRLFDAAQPGERRVHRPNFWAMRRDGMAG